MEQNKEQQTNAQEVALQIKQMEYELSPIGQERRHFETVQRQANMYAASNVVPDNYKNNMANCCIAVDMAMRMGANPLMVMQNLYIVHGQPSFSSKFLIAALNTTGRFSPLEYVWNDKEGEQKGCHAEATRKSDGKVLRGPEVTLEMAKKEGWSTKSGSKWITMPELMCCYRAAAFFQRLYAPEISMGFLSTEEAEDINPKTIDTSYEEVTAIVDAEVETEEAPTPEMKETAPKTTEQKPAENGELDLGQQEQVAQPRKPAFGKK